MLVAERLGGKGVGRAWSGQMGDGPGSRIAATRARSILYPAAATAASGAAEGRHGGGGASGHARGEAGGADGKGRSLVAERLFPLGRISYLETATPGYGGSRLHAHGGMPACRATRRILGAKLGLWAGGRRRRHGSARNQVSTKASARGQAGAANEQRGRRRVGHGRGRGRRGAQR